MFITQIKLLHFRNYNNLSLGGIGKGINIFYGKNAQGKTNLLEAVNICSSGRSFRVSADSKTIQFGEEKAYLFVEYEKENRKQTIEVLIEKDRKKAIKINGIPATQVRQLLGNLYTVIFSPEDIKMAKEAPGLRRAFLDGEISKIRPTYIDALKKYTEIIAQKNAALRRGKKDVQRIVEAYNAQLEGYMGIILKNRISYVKKLNEYVEKTYYKISGKEEKINVLYKATIQEDTIAKTLERLIPREIEDKSCTFGPHRDDLEFYVNGKEARLYASQGQLRSLILAVKISCLNLLEDSTGYRPILLLDDVFSELDEQRKKNLMKTLGEMQVFITTAEFEKAHKKANIAYFKVADGNVNKT